MKFLISLTITIALASTLPAQTATPVSSTAAQVEQELKEAEEAYRNGDFAAAQAHSERAMLLDPQNKKAPYFVARTIHAQYRPGNVTPENVAKAREAIIAYQRILERVPGDDEAYKAIAYLYGALKDEEALRQLLTQRANDVSMPNDKRAEALVVLGSKDWVCSFQITELPAQKVVIINKANKAIIRYKMPKERVEFEQAQECATRGLERVNLALTLTPENEAAWSYKTNLLLEFSKFAEMQGDRQSSKEFRRQYEEALKQTTKLSQRSQSNP